MMDEHETMNDRAGRRIRALRKAMGINQSKLASKLNVTYQQLQKYESGKNNISINMLNKISQALEVEPVHLLANSKGGNISDVLKSLISENASSRDIAEEFSSFQILEKISVIKDPDIQKHLRELLASLAAHENIKTEA